MARTTLDIDPSILRELRRRGEREGKSMGKVTSELLASVLAEPGRSKEAPEFSWTTDDLGAPQVDLEDGEALRRVLDHSP